MIWLSLTFPLLHFPSATLVFFQFWRGETFLPQALAEMTHTVHSECFIFSQVFLGLNPSRLLGLSLNAAWGFPSDSDGKRICLQYRRPGFDLWVEKTPWRREWQPTPVFLPGEFQGQRSLVGYSPWVQRVGHDWATNISLHFTSPFPGGFTHPFFISVSPFLPCK